MKSRASGVESFANYGMQRGASGSFLQIGPAKHHTAASQGMQNVKCSTGGIKVNANFTSTAVSSVKLCTGWMSVTHQYIALCPLCNKYIMNAVTAQSVASLQSADLTQL